MRYVRVASTAEMPNNTKKPVVVNGKEILLANVGDVYYAISNKCPHAGGSLAKGVLERGIVTCPNHGARFDVKTGESVEEIKIGFGKIKIADTERYSVKVEGTDILVGAPESEY